MRIFKEYEEVIPDFQGFLQSLADPLPQEFRINHLNVDPAFALALMEEEGCRSMPLLPEEHGRSFIYRAINGIKIGNLLAYKLGYIYPQSFTSFLCSLALNPTMESYVLDLCSAPGSKTTHMAQLMKNTGLIVANELFAKRLPALGQNIDRSGATNVVITSYQAQEFPGHQRFDFILADVPCSTEGKFRLTNKAQPIKWRYEKLINTQKRIIKRAYELLKPGGTMLYSTCTYSPQENEEVVDSLLKGTDAELVDLGLNIYYDPGITHFNGRDYDKRLQRAGRFYPHRTGSVGFFMAKIVKP